jgi:16S rRNA G966 N2-methylase RsmD
MRFYKTSLESLPLLENPMLALPAMPASSLNNNQKIKYKNVIRNMFWLEILKNTKTGIENVPTFMDVLEDLYKREIIDYKILTPSALHYIRTGHIASVFSSFYFRASIMNPYFVFSLAKSVLFRALSPKQTQSKHDGFNVFTPTLGWCSYLYGFAETKQISRYVGVDVIPSVCEKTAEFAKTHYPEINTKIICMPSEDLRKKKGFIKQYADTFDIVFFSPPYFQLELYEGELQSTTRYASLDEWMEKYWEMTIQLCHLVLKKGGVLCYIVSGYGNETDDEFTIVKKMNKITTKYVKQKRTYQMYNKNVNSTSHRETDERIYLFQK